MTFFDLPYPPPEKFKEMMDWCRLQFGPSCQWFDCKEGKGRWAVDAAHLEPEITILFVDDRDAMLFKLAWVGV